jgi:hypothetical protein
MLAVLFASLLDSMVQWCSYGTLKSLREMFTSLLKGGKSSYTEAESFLEQVLPFFERVMARL